MDNTTITESFKLKFFPFSTVTIDGVVLLSKEEAKELGGITEIANNLLKVTSKHILVVSPDTCMSDFPTVTETPVVQYRDFFQINNSYDRSRPIKYYPEVVILNEAFDITEACDEVLQELCNEARTFVIIYDFSKTPRCSFISHLMNNA